MQYAAAFALGRIGDKAHAAALEKAAKSDDHFLALVGIWASAKVDPENQEKLAAAVKALVAGLFDEHENHRVAAARGLMELKAPELVSKALDAATAKLDEQQVDRLLDAFAALGGRVVPRAIELLKDPKRRERAMKVLAKIGPEAAPAVPDLVALLKDEDPKVRTEALFALAAIGPKASAAIGPATAALADTDRDVMLTAGYFLGKLGPEAKEAAPALRKLLDSKDDLVKLTGVRCLAAGRSGEPRKRENGGPGNDRRPQESAAVHSGRSGHDAGRSGQSGCRRFAGPGSSPAGREPRGPRRSGGGGEEDQGIVKQDRILPRVELHSRGMAGVVTYNRVFRDVTRDDQRAG